jgi:PAS domain S-box-containing protein
MSRRRFVFLTSLTLVLAGPLLGFLTYRLVTNREEERLRSRFEEHLTNEAYELERDLHLFVEALHSLKALYDSSDEVTRQEFATFCGGVLERHPEIQALEWVEWVRGEEREAYERRVRRDGPAHFRITERDPSGHMVPAARRADYYPVLFAEPLAGNECAIGFDLGSTADRKAALDRSVATGGVVMTDPLELVQEIGSSWSVLLVLAVRESVDPLSRARGFATLVIRIEDLLGRTLLRDRSQARHEFRLVDMDAEGRPETLASSPGYDGEAGSLTLARTVRAGGQVWRLTGRPTAAYEDAHRSLSPLVLGVLAAAAWILLCGLVAVLARSYRNQALREKDRIIRPVLRSLSEGVVVADRNKELLLVNDAARKLVGMRDSRVRAGEWSSNFGVYDAETGSLYPEDRLPLSRAIRGETIKDVQCLIRNPAVPGGTWLSVSGNPIVDGDGETQGGVVILRDITERRRSEELVRRLSSAVEQTADAVIITDRQGSILYVNPAFERVTGYAREEAVGNTPRLLKSEQQDPTLYEELWSKILRGEVFRGTVVNRRKNGEIFYGEQTITPMKDHDGTVTHFVSVCRDMTDRRRVEAQQVEMHLAAGVQQRLYPQQSPEVHGFDIAGAVYPADATCGDYFDFVEVADGVLDVIIGDVCGHGLGPALIMAQTRAYLRSQLGPTSDLCEVITQTNRFLAADLEDHLFVTLLLARIDTRKRSLSFTSAGHTPGYVLDANGVPPKALRRTGLPLGILADAEFGCSEPIELDPGSIAVFLTDGVTEAEAPDGTRFEDERALEVVRRYRHESAAEIVTRVRAAVEEFRGGMPQRDDISLVVAKLEVQAPVPREDDPSSLSRSAQHSVP